MTDIEFQPFPKIARLNRDVIVTEKIDGTNAAIGVDEAGNVWAQSRTRLITPEQDNFGFARWVYDNALALSDALGPGLHFGEWWGSGIQRGYEQKRKRFSLFNTARWHPMSTGVELPDLLDVVPILYEGMFDPFWLNIAIQRLREQGSAAAPGFMKPEGVVIYHTAARSMFKVTLEGDEKPKGSTE